MMVLRKGISLLVAVLVANLSGTFATSFCREQQSPSVYNVDIFEEVISNHTDILQTLQPAPFVRGAEENTPMYEFGGTGFLLNDNGLSSAIRSSSCSTNEVTLYASVFFVDSHSGGPVLQIFNGNDATARLPVFGMYMDALGDEITLAYRHAGEPRLVSLGVRLHGGRWGRYAIVLSGNLMKVYVNCHEVLSQIIPLPDYCANYPSLVVSVAESADQEHDEFTTGIYGYLQSVGFQFGRGGILRQCQQLGDVCPTCGQFLNLVQRVHELRHEVDQLNTRVEMLESGTGPVPGMTTDPPTPSTGQSCLIDGTTVAHGSFHSVNRRVCFCLDGNPSCTEVNAEDCERDGNSGNSGATPTTTSTATSTGPNRTPDDEDPTDSTQVCTIRDLDNLRVPVGEAAFNFDNGDCIVFFCEIGRFGPSAPPTTFECFGNYTSCRANFDPFQQEIAQCCRICDACDFVTDCPENSHCMIEGDTYHCQCDAGFEMQGNLCVDRNECELGLQQGGHNCPTNSECRNTPGNFTCDCNEGFIMTINTNGVRRCEDVDECELETDDCPSNSMCMNTEGSFTCMCDAHYEMVDGECRPVCDPPCENGGECVSPDRCMCHRGYTGANCESDIDECALGLNTCTHPESQCINTVGGYFCQCRPGFHGNGSFCEDVNECATRIHNCINRVAACVNTIGSFFCMCNDDRGSPFDCSGACISRTSMMLMNGQSEYDARTCRNCTCLEGELLCRRHDCDCSRVQPSDRSCCPQCFRSDCIHSPSGTLIRPGNTWINPENRCERFTCTSRSGNLVLVPEDISSQCAPLACSGDDSFVPVGRCCPICTLPPCTSENIGEVVSLRNGCKTCECDGVMSWQCTETLCFSMETCDPEQILFYKDGCCPVCEAEALGTQTCATVS